MSGEPITTAAQGVQVLLRARSRYKDWGNQQAVQGLNLAVDILRRHMGVASNAADAPAAELCAGDERRLGDCESRPAAQSARF